MRTMAMPTMVIRTMVIRTMAMRTMVMRTMAMRMTRSSRFKWISTLLMGRCSCGERPQAFVARGQTEAGAAGAPTLTQADNAAVVGGLHAGGRQTGPIGGFKRQVWDQLRHLEQRGTLRG